jgi:hypothetical protein
MKDLWSEAIMANYFIFTNSFSDCFFRDICYNYIRDIFLLSAGSGLHQGNPELQVYPLTNSFMLFCTFS